MSFPYETMGDEMNDDDLTFEQTRPGNLPLAFEQIHPVLLRDDAPEGLEGVTIGTADGRRLRYAFPPDERLRPAPEIPGFPPFDARLKAR